MANPFNIFIAYARKDADLLDELRTHLTPLERAGTVKIWYDGKIEPGVVWEQAIKDNLHTADIILLLVSAHAIASDYFYEKEMSDALARHHAGSARVVPLILRSCAWQTTPLGGLQSLPRDGKPVSTWADRDDAYADAVISLNTMLQGILHARAEATEAEQRRRADAEEVRLAALARQQQQSEEQNRLEEQQRLQAAAAAERRKKEQEQAAEKQRQLDEQRRQTAAAAERRRQQQQADRLKKAEEERRRREAAAKQRQQQMAALGKGIRSPRVWGSGLVGLIALLLGNWLCNQEPSPTLPLTQEGQDTTLLTENTPETADTQVSVKTISPKQLPPDVTVEQPKKKQEEKTAEASPKKEEPKPTTSRKSGFEMVFVKGGSFTMGSPKSEKGRDDDECPHEATVGDYSIGKYEITQADWKAVMGGFPEEQGTPNCGQCPVEGVSWNDIQDFLKKAYSKYNKRYRLPTEAEWEYAARGGSRSKGFLYSGGNNLGSVAWYDGNSGYKTHPVGEKTANELGLHDMSGNVYEWCADLYKAYPGCTAYECSGCRVMRGGSWLDYPPNCRTAYRDRFHSAPRYSNIGFRLVSLL